MNNSIAHISWIPLPFEECYITGIGLSDLVPVLYNMVIVSAPQVGSVGVGLFQPESSRSVVGAEKANLVEVHMKEWTLHSKDCC